MTFPKGLAFVAPIVAMFVGWSCPYARADEFKTTPDTVKFDFEQQGDTQNQTCNLMMMIFDPSRPETVNFRTIHILAPTALFFGFTVDVGDMRYQNGLPAGLDQVALASGDVSTKSFSTVGSMYGGPISGGGILKSTADGKVAAGLWQAILGGEFSIHVLRAAPGAEPRTYVIAEAPTPGPLAQYLACSAAISDIALGKPANPDLYAKIRRGGPGITQPLKVEPTPDHPAASIIPALAEQSPLVGKR